MCLESQKGSPSYNDLAARIESHYSISVSKQAVWKRVNDACVLFFQAILAQIIKEKAMGSNEANILYSQFGNKRVIIQDSTVFKLPLRLFSIFSGVRNRITAVCNVRVQGVYDLLAGQFLHFSIDAYSRNDLLAVPDLKIRKDDLSLRDRGYFTFSEFERHKKAGADCIYRHKFPVSYLNPTTKMPIDLLGLLKKHKRLDMEVCMNNPEHTKVRLMAQPVSQEIASKRRMKAKKHNKGHNPGKLVLELMAWTIYVTTIPKEKATYEQISSLYRCRWRIEQIFKAWKSHMEFDNIHNVSYHQAMVLLTARLILIVVCTHKVFIPYERTIHKKYNRYLSMQKLFRYLRQNQEQLARMIHAIDCQPDEAEQICSALLRYCVYDKRKRLNSSIYERLVLC